MSRDAYLVGGVRTPVGRYGGALSSVRVDDLAALVLSEVISRAGISGADVDEVIFGSANQAGEDNRNVARMAVLLAGLPEHVPGFTVNRLCASGLQAIVSASLSIRAGDADIVVAGGCESMTRAPWVMTKPGTPWAKPGEVADTALGWRLVNPRMRPLDNGDATMGLGEAVEKLARLDGVTRADADEYAVRSQSAASASWESGFFDEEIVAVPVAKGAPVERDETVRADTTLEGLARLTPSFSTDGLVTAGNASPLSDGASAVIVASGDAVRKYGLVPRARIVASAAAGVAPSLFGIGPVPAITKVLDKTGIRLGDVGAVEINEAFAAQVIACERRLGLDRNLVNSAGGAIALGHPLGSSGVRITLTLLNRMQRGEIEFGLSSLCVGVGQGSAMLVERV